MGLTSALQLAVTLLAGAAAIYGALRARALERVIRRSERTQRRQLRAVREVRSSLTFAHGSLEILQAMVRRRLPDNDNHRG